jgi:uncharacterized protein (DUF111 family)
MKKNRPGMRLTVICRPQDANRLAEFILSESSAIGVRMHETRRLKLRRESASLKTSIGVANVKLIYRDKDLLRITPEHASCEALSQNTKRSLPDVYRIITEQANRQFGLED